MATSHIPVILLTARGDLDSTTMGYKLGADAYLAKAFRYGIITGSHQKPAKKQGSDQAEI